MKKRSSSKILKDEIAKSRDFLAKNRFHETIGQKRKEVTKKLSYMMKRLVGEQSRVTPLGVHYGRLQSLTAVQMQDVHRIVEGGYKRLSRHLRGSVLLVDVKSYHRRGVRHKYTVHLRLEGPQTVILSARQTDWDLPKALHKAVANLEMEAAHRFKFEGKPRRGKKKR